METTSLKQEVETLKIALATARAEASKAKSHAASAAVQFATQSRSPKEDSGGFCEKGVKGEQAITNRGLGEPFLQQDSETESEHEGHKAKKAGKKRDVKMAPSSSIFPDVDKMRENVREHLAKEEYNVEDFYKESGFAQDIAKNPNFKNLAFVVIALNTIWIAIDTDCNKFDILTDAPLWIQIGENAFCVFFVFEITMRFLAFKRKSHCFSDSWMMFDSTLVLLMVWETWMAPLIAEAAGAGQSHDDHALMIEVTSCPISGVMKPQVTGGGGGSASSIFRVFRLFRLTRVARLARLLNGMPELMVLIKGMMIATRSVFSTLALLVIIIYVFAILLTQTLSTIDAEKFPAVKDFETVPTSMNTLLLQGVFPDQGASINALLAVDISYYFILILYLVVGSLTVMNMLLGVICEVISVVAQVEKEESTGIEIKQRLSELLPDLDKDGDGQISWYEFQSIVSNPLAIRTLDELEINCFDLVECGPMLFAAKDHNAQNHEDTQISMEDFIGAVLKFRGDNPATLTDLFNLKHIIAKEMSTQLQHFHMTNE